MPASFDFRTQTIQFDFESGPSFVPAVREAAAAKRDDQLNFNRVASVGDKTVFQSPTGSTLAEVVPGRAVVLTQFFGDYVHADAAQKRREYARLKLETLLAYLDRAGASLRYVGFTSIARVSAAQVGDRETLHAAAIRALGIEGRWTEGERCFDFTLRVSRTVGAAVFSNVTLEWFQDRAFQISMAPGDSSRVLVASSAIWDLPLTDEGVQFRYDRNNKKGLFDGRRNWTPAEFMDIVDGAIADAPKAIAPFSASINAELGGAQ